MRSDSKLTNYAELQEKTEGKTQSVWSWELKFMQMIVSGGLEGGVKGNESPLQGAD